MKKTIIAFFAIIAIFAVLIVTVSFATGKKYKDGTYSGTSRSIYTSEPYYGTVTVTVDGGRITQVVFFVRDSAKHELFDDKYERYFAGNDEYIRQCRNDLKGIQTYPEQLIKYQDPDGLDAVSGATWSYNIFRASVKEALAGAVEE